MAITAGDFIALKHVRKENLLPKGCSFLEIGEQNWYGDVNGQQLVAELAPFDPNGDVREKLRVVTQIPDPKSLYLFDVADVVYETLIQHDPAKRVSIDMNGRDRAIKHDLNEFWIWEKIGIDKFDYVNNLGTAEHVFNQDNVFSIIHHRCRVGGIVQHALPMWGWFDHGFYNYSPTFIEDLVAANGYEVLLWLCSEVCSHRPPNVHNVKDGMKGLHELRKHLGADTNAMSHLLLRKVKDDPFKVAYQGYYRNSLSAELAAKWAEGR